MDDGDPGEWLTTTQVAALLGVSSRRVKQLLQSGRLPQHRKLGNYNVFRRAEIEAFRATRRPPGRPSRSVAAPVSEDEPPRA